MQLGGYGLEALLWEAKTTNNKRHAKDKEEVAEKSTKKGTLDKGKFTTLKRDTGNDEFDEVT